MQPPDGQKYRKFLFNPEEKEIVDGVSPIQEGRTDKYLRHRIRGDEDNKRESQNHAYKVYRKKTLRAGK